MYLQSRQILRRARKRLNAAMARIREWVRNRYRRLGWQFLMGAAYQCGSLVVLAVATWLFGLH